MKRIFAAIVILAVACACTASPPPLAATSQDLAPGPCATAGGKMAKVCRRQVERCVTPYRDAGKTCTDGAQCAGDCLFNGPEPKPGAPLVGACQKDNDPCGCFAPLVNGKISDMARCID